MAAAQQPKTQSQSQSQSQPQSQQAARQNGPPTPISALDNLQAMVNLVLMQSGRYIKEQQGGGGSGVQLFAMKRAVPAALARFQDSLDELESELQQAQAVMRRDLAAMQADRVQREHAERQRLAAETSTKKSAPVIKDEPVPSPAAEPAEPVEPIKEDVAMSDAPPVEKKEEEESVAPADPAPTTAPADPLFDGTPTTANAPDTDFDFDAMFGDMTNDGDGASGDVIMDSQAPDLNFDLDESGPSLLRGLEDFANSGDTGGGDQAGATATANMNIDDFAMPELPDLGDSTLPDLNAGTTKQEEPAPPTKTETPAQDLNTSSAPETSAAADNADSADLMQPMGTDDLDDLFNMDYENPETTEFENAFFGFDES